MPMLKLKNPKAATQSKGTAPSPRTALSKAAESFASKWLYRFSLLNHELELAKYESEPDENNFDVEDDSHMRQLEAVGHTQEHLINFDNEAAATELSMKTYINKPITQNPFLIADDLRDFVFTFLEAWVKVRGEGWHGIPRHSFFMKGFITKLNVLWRENNNLTPLPGYKRPTAGPMKGLAGAGKQGRPKASGKKKVDRDEEDGDYNNWRVEGQMGK